jgi:hypothetical protein
VITPGRWAVYYAPDRKAYVVACDGARHDFSRKEAEDIRQALGVALAYGATYDPVPDTDRAPADAVTRRSTPAAIHAVREPSKTTCPTCAREARYTARNADDLCPDPFHVRRPSGSLRAVHLPEPGHHERIAAALAGGKEPPTKT